MTWSSNLRMTNRRVPAITPDEVIDCAADLFKVTPADLRGHDRHRPLVVYRAVTMAACRMATPYSLPSIAGAFDCRHHTSVVKAVHRVRADERLIRQALEVVVAVRVSTRKAS